VYRKVRMLLGADPRATFGLAHLLPASADEVFGALGRLAGTPLPAEGSGQDRCVVDPSTLASQASAAAERLRDACARGERVLFGTGHPAGPIDLYARLAQAMGARGARVMRFAEAEPFDMDEGYGRGQIRFVGDVACLSSGGDLLHTHSPRPMEYLLDTGPMPDLVVGDHGFVGVGLARGAEAVSLIDTNDPALVLAWARGLRIWPLLCDDNRPPACYAPLADFLLARL
jgi:hypothetical protein